MELPPLQSLQIDDPATGQEESSEVHSESAEIKGAISQSSKYSAVVISDAESSSVSLTSENDVPQKADKEE